MTEPKNNSGKTQQNFQIGQIVYLLSEKAEAIVPAIVVEELILKKLAWSPIHRFHHEQAYILKKRKC